MLVDACSCGGHPEVKEIKTVTYVALCECGAHGPVMPLREWAVSEWNRKVKEDGDVVKADRAA